MSEFCRAFLDTWCTRCSHTKKEDLLQTIDPDLDNKTLLELIDRDRLLATMIAKRDKLPETMVHRLFSMNDPLIFDAMANSPCSGADILEKIADLSPDNLLDALKHPHTSEELLERPASKKTTL
jgi:hypothetical protein